jgi:hypothetical protein
LMNNVKSQFHFEDIQRAYIDGSISLKSFAEVLADNFGKKKARKILRKNIEVKLIEEKMPFDKRQEHLSLISLII